MTSTRRGAAAGAPRRVLVAPDAFKGTFSAPEVAAALAAGLRGAGVGVDVCPLADGGEGTAAVLAGALGGRPVAVEVSGPLGAPVAASFVLTDDGTVLAEAAAACGLHLVPAAERGPASAVRADTRGVGELLVAAARLGARRILLGVGGSATTDGGAGALAAVAAAGGLTGVELVVLCDVTTAYEDAARVFGPQKGADPATVDRLTARLHDVAAGLPRDPRGRPRTGCAGGLSGALWAALDAGLVPGADAVLDAVDFDRRARAADAVVTGEGRFDASSELGKLVSVVRDRAGRPVHLVVGASDVDERAARAAGYASLRLAPGADDDGALRAAGADLARALGDPPVPR